MRALLGGERADLVFTDPPYNVPIDGHVSGLGRIRHREFAMGAARCREASSPPSSPRRWARRRIGAATARSPSSAWTGVTWRELLAGRAAVFTELKNLCVWNKTNGGMGAFYRSKHELVFVFKAARRRTSTASAWARPAATAPMSGTTPASAASARSRDEALAMHPTVKPVALVADAIRDCSRRGEVVLDPFGGSGTTLIAAERRGRLARLIEYDPALLRHHHPALRGVHREGGDAGGGRGGV